MKITPFVPTLAAVFFCALLPASPAQSADKPQPTPAQQSAELKKGVSSTIADYKKTDPKIDRFFKQSEGYAVFPRVGKVGFIIGGGDGIGEVYDKAKLVGTATMTFATVGLQAGAQEFSEVIFFKDRAALERFKESKFEFDASASAVVVKAGASASTDYRAGVAVFTKPRGGAMLEASLGTQKFKFTPKAAAAKKK